MAHRRNVGTATVRRPAAVFASWIAACFAAFVEDIDGAGASVSEQDDDDSELETLEPGHVAYLKPGQSVSFAQPPVSADDGFSTRTLRRIAASLGVTYEDLTGDYS